MVESQITLAWILQEPARARDFIEYGLGRWKLTLEQVKLAFENDDPDGEAAEVVKDGEAWLNSQRYDFLTEVNVGSWANKDLRQMADEVGLGRLYRLEFDVHSGAAHGMWQHVGQRNLVYCRDPLHRVHRIPLSEEPHPDPIYALDAATHLENSFALFDKAYPLPVEADCAACWLKSNSSVLYETMGWERAGSPVDAEQ